MPGLALAAAMKSASVCIGLEAGTTSRYGTVTICVTAAKSFTGSNESLE